MKRIENNEIIRTVVDVVFIILAAFVGAIGVIAFSTPGSFAPIGADGISLMLSQIVPQLGFEIWSLIINIPLLVIGFFFLKKKYLIYTLIYIGLNSLFVYLYELFNFPIMPASDTSLRILCAIFAGVLLGIRTGLMLRIGGSSGGIDIPACIFSNKFPGKNAEWAITLIGLLIIGSSYFLYKDFISILLSVIEMGVLYFAAEMTQKSYRNAIEFKIVTKHPEEIKEIIIYRFKHGVTLVESKGGYTEEGSTILFTVINTRQLSMFINELKKIPNTFMYYTNVNGVQGNFRWRNEDKAK